jgi:hypothetical protein
MPIPAPTAPRPELPPDIGAVADGDVAAPAERPPEPVGLEPSAYANWPLTLPIAIHLPLYIISFMAGFLGMPLLVVTHRPSFVPQWLTPIAFLGSALVGLFLVKLVFRLLILGRCPKCGGPARVRDGRPMTYTCMVCGHIHRTPVSGG